MESYGSIIHELDVLISFHKQSWLPEPSTSSEAGPWMATPWEVPPRPAITALQTGTSRISESHSPLQAVQAHNKCRERSAQIITTFNQYANSLEFIGQLRETEEAQKLIVSASIPLFIFADFVQEVQLALTEAIQLLNNTQATQESLSLDLGLWHRRLKDAVKVMRQRSVDWNGMMENQLLAVVKQGDEGLTERSGRFVSRNSENWKVLVDALERSLSSRTEANAIVEVRPEPR
ncbi:hypothetical protein M407DRAFT_33346 [Tulasnella calospora MUT 4182]|uniref:Uncharacterized protein n=1 Tax=Tulasnella calospora MUT 4182 TaxID=1051891 RepID=A0A0C3K6K7_9AGAM|nr:hypothetical protein M407DRAFT_33346 [Tulasnella calospora MUT 4182]